MNMERKGREGFGSLDLNYLDFMVCINRLYLLKLMYYCLYFWFLKVFFF